MSFSPWRSNFDRDELQLRGQGACLCCCRCRCRWNEDDGEGGEGGGSGSGSGKFVRVVMHVVVLVVQCVVLLGLVCMYGGLTFWRASDGDWHR